MMPTEDEIETILHLFVVLAVLAVLGVVAIAAIEWLEAATL